MTVCDNDVTSNHCYRPTECTDAAVPSCWHSLCECDDDVVSGYCHHAGCVDDIVAACCHHQTECDDDVAAACYHHETECDDDVVSACCHHQTKCDDDVVAASHFHHLCDSLDNDVASSNSGDRPTDDERRSDDGVVGGSRRHRSHGCSAGWGERRRVMLPWRKRTVATSASFFGLSGVDGRDVSGTDW